MRNTNKVCSILIILFYTVGLIGFLTPALNPLFLKLVPFHLLLMLMLLLISHSDKNRLFWVFIATTFLLGFIVEVVGVNTGWVFGSYKYGATLGFKVFNTPLLIGINWVMLIYTTGILINQFKFKSLIFSSALGAVALVILDLLIEPIAIKFDYWNWYGRNIPLQNYFGWFGLSFFLLFFFLNMPFEKKNSSAIVLFFTQLAFFVALNL